MLEASTPIHGLTGPQRSESRLRELVPHWNDDARDTEYQDEDKINDFRWESAVEAVVEPWHEGAHRQQGDAAVIKPVMLPQTNYTCDLTGTGQQWMQ